MSSLWEHSDAAVWQAALDTYPAVIARQGVARLPALDQWYREELPALLAARLPVFVTHAELVVVVEWKMARGVWRARNLALVRSNAPEVVEQTSREALARVPDPTAPLIGLARLAGVGPATASAIVAAAAPEHYPFFDEVVAGQIPGFGAVAFTLGEYRRYAAALRERAEQLGPSWTPVLVERALWAAAGGKAGPAAISP
jgi:hypothetical protein